MQDQIVSFFVGEKFCWTSKR